MKKIISLLVATGLTFALVACGSEAAGSTATETEAAVVEDATATDPATAVSDAGSTKDKIIAYFTETNQTTGEYVIFDEETTEENGLVSYVVRYQMSDEEAEELMADGGTPAANIYVTTVTENTENGEVCDETGNLLPLK